MQMSHCPVCGEKLSLRPHPTEPPTLWCSRCSDWRFPLFSAAVSVILLDQSRERMLLIRQYGEPDPVLPAGYVDKAHANTPTAMSTKVNILATENTDKAFTPMPTD